jgi:hypothetical protein
MKKYPFEVDKQTKWQASWWYMDGHSISFHGKQTERGIVPSLMFPGLWEKDNATPNDIFKLADAVQLCINHSGKGNKRGGLAMEPTSEYHNPDNIIWTFAVFPRDKERATINVKVYTDETRGGSCVIWCSSLVLEYIPSMEQFKTSLSSAAAKGRDEAIHYLRRNLPK